jgi:hypothetical protein
VGVDPVVFADGRGDGSGGERRAGDVDALERLRTARRLAAAVKRSAGHVDPYASVTASGITYSLNPLHGARVTY